VSLVRTGDECSERAQRRQTQRTCFSAYSLTRDLNVAAWRFAAASSLSASFFHTLMCRAAPSPSDTCASPKPSATACTLRRSKLVSVAGMSSSVSSDATKTARRAAIGSAGTPSPVAPAAPAAPAPGAGGTSWTKWQRSPQRQPLGVP
jgi:hypothetical protein